MCGIVGILSRPSNRAVPTTTDVLGGLDAALAARPSIGAVAGAVWQVDRLLRGVAGVRALVDHHELVAGITARLDQLDAFAAEHDGSVERLGDEAAIEAASAALIDLRDALWAVRQDRLRTAREVAALAGRGASPEAVAGYVAIQQALSAIDRLEVRGRDSAGLHVFVWGDALDPTAGPIGAALAQRGHDPLFQARAVCVHDRVVSFVYKAAAEIGQLGDNTRVMRAQILDDPLLRLAIGTPGSHVAALGHTRWASVGIISEPNAHPINSEEMERSAGGAPYVVAALNGDVDNHADLRVEHQLRIPAPITTDAKVIPTLVSRRVAAGTGLVEAFRRTVASFEGSVAIAAASADDPGTLLLALQGSGQGLYVGLADHQFVVASEPYGLVEECERYVRMDGESGGQILVLDAERAGSLEGIARYGYDGAEDPLSGDDVVAAAVTTRDIDRGDWPHFLLKEIVESPESFRKTLRGKLVERAGLLSVSLGDRALPPTVRAALADGSITRVRVIGQGTAAVAGQSAAALIDELTESRIDVDPITATELSGFKLGLDMRDTLVVAISQSGTTTDTNRTVDLARSRGAHVIAIVNRRGSDLTDKADGVVYTSDGRDVEMSVASTKAFYSQVAAGALLACAIADAAGLGDARRRDALLRSLRELPEAMRAVVDRRPRIAEAARRFAPSRRYWAVVGNGPNKVAAEEVRIKLSELCYKSIACDVTEDKKHIDLSSEPLVLVCAAGLSGSNADDVAKEVAIYRAHKATPVVIANEGEVRYPAAAVIHVPPVDPALGFVLSAMVGHLFGYEAALAIDALARPLRAAREVIELAVGRGADGDQALGAVVAELPRHVDAFDNELRLGSYDGQLEASTAVNLVTLLRHLTAERPVESYQFQSGKTATPAALLDDLALALTRAIEELTRPIDAIKHQAKTVTVGISRSDEGVVDRALVREVLAAGPGRDVLSYRTLRVLAALDPAVAAVVGFTRYRIDGDPSADATISIVNRGGISLDVPSRVEGNPRLVGTKRRVAAEREVLVARGRHDGRTVIFVPEVKSATAVGITLLHVRFHDRLPVEVTRGVLQGYDRRYDRLVDWVTETEGTFDESVLAEIPVVDLLVAPISETADHWRRGQPAAP
jgi:glucosamine--fructose-6-phosphate aminotransferase (isomerizing)